MDVRGENGGLALINHQNTAKYAGMSWACHNDDIMGIPSMIDGDIRNNMIFGCRENTESGVVADLTNKKCWLTYLTTKQSIFSAIKQHLWI